MFPISDSIQSKQFPLITYLLVLVTFAIFFVEITSSNPDSFIATYGLIPSQIILSNPLTWYRFVTAIFLHGGWLHIISNLWFLFVFGDNVESTFGKFKYLLFYFFAGVVGNIVQYLLMPSSTIPEIGASGAIAGVLGAYFVLFPKAKVKTFVPFIFIFFIELPEQLILGYWFVLQVLSGISPSAGIDAGGIAIFAHIGGFLSGMVLAKLAPMDN